ncbi:MAG: NAD(P)/FAD-dependent oxidoreductase [Halobacteria archaeon]
MKTVIIGGGLAGLAAAHALKDALVLEKQPVLGGAASSYCLRDYYIERYYHHIFKVDREVIALIKKLGLENKLEWRRATTGYYVEGRAYDLNTPLEILKYPYLSLMDKFKLALFTIKNKNKKRNLEDLCCITAREWILRELGESCYQNFFEPLLRSKFGDNSSYVSAAWLAGRVRIRSQRSLSGEILGYLRGGFHQLINALARDIEFKVNCEVRKIAVNKGRVEGVETQNEFIPCENVISTIPLALLNQLLDVKLLLPEIKYQGAACLLLALKQPLTDIYWLNINVEVPFGAIIEHTNFIPVSDYGEHLVYLASYFQSENDYRWRMKAEELIEVYIKNLEELFPSFSRNQVIWAKLSRDLYAGPIYDLNYSYLPYASEIKGLYLAGMFSEPNYPERSMNGSIKAGLEVARLISSE